MRKNFVFEINSHQKRRKKDDKPNRLLTKIKRLESEK